jgi:hypothetical protein
MIYDQNADDNKVGTNVILKAAWSGSRIWRVAIGIETVTAQNAMVKFVCLLRVGLCVAVAFLTLCHCVFAIRHTVRRLHISVAVLSIEKDRVVLIPHPNSHEEECNTVLYVPVVHSPNTTPLFDEGTASRVAREKVDHG